MQNEREVIMFDESVTPVDLDQLPRYSHFVRNFIETAESRHFQPESSTDVLREYEDEKWGFLLQKILTGHARDLESLENVFFSEDLKIGSIGKRLVVGSEIQLHKHYMSNIVETIVPLFSGCSVIEIGAGYGAFSLRLNKALPAEKRESFIALDISDSGLECLKILGKNFPNLVVGQANINLSHVTNVAIPAEATFLTSMSIPYLEEGSVDSFFSWILSKKPRRVIHVEPLCIDEQTSLLSMLRKQYMLACGYHGSLLLHSALHRLEISGDLRIVALHHDVAGANALLPASVVCWEPA